MAVNVGSADRIVRIIAGVAILSLLFILEGSTRWWGFIGIVLVVTGLVRWCPAYAILGMNSCGKKTAH